MSAIKIIECPRDAMQGLHDFIPTEIKANYINKLLKVGFDTIDFGSFVSPKAIPQLRDTAEVLSMLNLEETNSKLLSIVANERGASDAINFEEIKYLGFPFSISETFQQRNTNSNIEQSLSRVEAIQNLALKANKEVVLYVSIGFGNPYGDEYREDIVAKRIGKLSQLEIKTFALSDTIGVSEPGIIQRLFSTLIPEFENLEIGAHLHTTPDSWREKVLAASNNGCARFDGAIAGFGGCPMATDDLTGNMATENIISYFTENNIELGLNLEEFKNAQKLATSVFPL
jgi:hydroxymethylglutaryl-CoA lyase